MGDEVRLRDHEHGGAHEILCRDVENRNGGDHFPRTNAGFVFSVGLPVLLDPRPARHTHSFATMHTIKKRRAAKDDPARYHTVPAAPVEQLLLLWGLGAKECARETHKGHRVRSQSIQPRNGEVSGVFPADVEGVRGDVDHGRQERHRVEDDMQKGDGGH